MTRYVWVAASKAEGFPTTMACKVAEVSRQAFYDWKAREATGPTPRQLTDSELVEQIREIHGDNDGTYGVPRMTVELANRGSSVITRRRRCARRSQPRTIRRCLIWSAGGSPREHPTCAGAATSHTCRPVKAGCMSHR